MELERRTILVQFIAVAPVAFYATSDGTDLIQNILRSQFTRPDADKSGQEGSISIDDRGEFLSFEPTDTKNRTLRLATEHLAYCGALRRLRRDTSDHRNPDQIKLREYENVDLANRYAHYITGPPIFVAIFHGFDNALCYTFVTQSADDACLLVMKLMRAFRQYEQQHEEQGRINQGFSSHLPINSGGGSPSSVARAHDSPLHQLPAAPFIDNKQVLSSPPFSQTPNMHANICTQNPYQDELVQKLLCNPNLELISQPYGSSMLSAPSSSLCYSSMDQPATIVVRTDDICCPSYSHVPQETFMCNVPQCSRCCLSRAPSLCVTEASPVFPSYYYSL